MTDFTKTFRRTTYPAISPTNPLNDQTGHTVLVVGASEGIGFGIAQAYAEANAKEVIISSRSQTKLDHAASKIGSKSKITTIVLDASKVEDIEAFWKESLKNVKIDVLVLSAAATHKIKEENPIEVAEYFHMNVISKLHMISHFKSQSTPGCVLIDVSSAALQCYPYPKLAYSASKIGMSGYLCHLAEQEKEEVMRIVNFHPGAVFTEAARKSGEVSENLGIWDDPSLSAHMGLWLSTPAAAFLHGRYVWANWDVDELMAMKDEIGSDPGMLKTGIGGVKNMSIADLMTKCAEQPRKKT